MTDTSTANDAGQQTQDPGDQSQNPGDQSQATDDQGTQGRQGSIESLPKWAQSHIKELREEAASRRKQAQEREDKARREALSDQERAIEDAKNEAFQTVEQRYQPLVKKAFARAELASQGVKDPDRAVRLLELDDIEISDNGDVKGLDKAVKSLLEEFPELVGRETNPDIGNRGDKSGQKPDMNKTIRAAFGRG